MKCKNCGNLIPDQSVFCPYCGVSSAEALQYQPNASQISTPPAPKAQHSTPLSDKVKGKVRECPKCGALLSKKEKVCSICGEAMPKKPRNAKTAIISMSIAICLLLCSAVYFMLEMFQGNRTIDQLTAEVTSLHNQIGFYEQYVAVIELQHKDYYHSYGCPYLEVPLIINIYSKEAAKNRGYFPCPYCQ